MLDTNLEPLKTSHQKTRVSLRQHILHDQLIRPFTIIIQFSVAIYSCSGDYMLVSHFQICRTLSSSGLSGVLSPSIATIKTLQQL
jgi:hypothetical protein